MIFDEPIRISLSSEEAERIVSQDLKVSEDNLQFYQSSGEAIYHLLKTFKERSSDEPQKVEISSEELLVFYTQLMVTQKQFEPGLVNRRKCKEGIRKYELQQTIGITIKYYNENRIHFT